MRGYTAVIYFHVVGKDPSEDAGTGTKNETLWRSGEMENCPEKSFPGSIVDGGVLAID